MERIGWATGAPAFRLFSTCLLGSLLVTPAQSATMQIVGCEAADMSLMLGLGNNGHWWAREIELGHWRLVHTVDLTCDGHVCEAAGGLRSQRRLSAPASTTQWPTTADGQSGHAHSVLPPSTPGLSETLLLGGEIAQEIAEAITPVAYLGGDGRNHFTWVDYGDIASDISLRARSEIACDLTGAQCDLTTLILVFISYDEHHDCGYISGRV